MSSVVLFPMHITSRQDLLELCSVLLSIVATIVWRIPLLHSLQWSAAVATPFSRIRQFHCCNFIAGVTVPAEVVNYATAFDTIHRDPPMYKWDLRPQDVYRRPKPPQPRFSFVSNKLIRAEARRATLLVEAFPRVRYSDPSCKSTLQPLITDICRLMCAYGISVGCVRQNIA